MIFDTGLRDYKSTILHFISRYSKIITVNMLGRSHDGTGIYDICLGKPTARKQIVLHAGCHARESLNTCVLMDMLEYFCENYTACRYHGKRFMELFETCAVHFLPLLNPDGAMLSHFGPAGIQNEHLRTEIQKIFESDLQAGYTALEHNEYFRRWKANAKGVDLNRNFDSAFGQYPSRSAPSCENYKGIHPESEPESTALAHLIATLYRAGTLCAVLSYHSSGEEIYWDYGQTGKRRTMESTLVRELSALTGYRLLPEAPDEAGCSDWVSRRLGVFACTIETGKHSAPVPEEELPEITARNMLVPCAAADFFVNHTEA